MMSTEEQLQKVIDKIDRIMEEYQITHRDGDILRGALLDKTPVGVYYLHMVYNTNRTSIKHYLQGNLSVEDLVHDITGMHYAVPKLPLKGLL